MTGHSSTHNGPAPAPRFQFEPTASLNPTGSDADLRRFVYPDGHHGWVTGNYELARAVLSDPRFSVRSELKHMPIQRPGAEWFVGEQTLPGFFIDLDPPEHTLYRRLLAPYFSQRRMKLLRPRIEEIVDTHLTDLAERGSPGELVNTFALATTLQVLLEFMGIPYSARETVRQHRDTLFSLEASPAETTYSLNVLNDLVLEVINDKKVRSDDDLLGGLAHEDALTTEEVAGLGVLFLTAGHETVGSMLVLGTLALLLNPGVFAAVDWEGPSIPDVVEELLRYLSIFHVGVQRAAIQDLELAGHVIKAGENVAVAIPSANRDPAHFSEPDTLNFARAEGAHVAFGHGLHQCVGQNLARTEMLIAYPALFRRFPGLRLATDPGDIEVVRDGAIYTLHELLVAW